LAAGRHNEARDAYGQALALAGDDGQGVNLPALQQKLQSLTPVPARTPGATTNAAVSTNDTVDAPKE
jgi:hypothetical protein